MYPLKTKTLITSSLLGVLFMSGCGRDEVSAYRVAKEDPKDAHAGHNHAKEATPVPTHQSSTPSPPTTPSSDQKWKTPATWKQGTPGPMVLATYTAGAPEASVTISVSMFPGDVGGTLANINRWRGQLGQAPALESDLPKLIQQITLPDATATLVDFVGTNAKTSEPSRMLGAIVPRGGNSWFYKMTGDSKTVEAEKKSFIEFIGVAH